MKLIAETNDNKAMEEMTDSDFIDCFRVSLYSPNSGQICLSSVQTGCTVEAMGIPTDKGNPQCIATFSRIQCKCSIPQIYV